MNDRLPLQQPVSPDYSPQPQSVAVEAPTTIPVQPLRELKIHSHSSLVFWWPVWAVGYVMAGLTYWRGQQYQIGQDRELFHESSNLGVFYFLTLFLVVMITNVSVKGLVSGLVILGIALVSVLLAYFSWWDEIFAWFGGLKIHLNFGAYFWFSTLMLLVWLVSVFVVDRLSYWHFKSGQLTHAYVFGSGSKSYDTMGMVMVKHREDLFRHWLLGIGSGDLEIHTTGAVKERIEIDNVLFIGSKIELIQRLIAETPDAT